MINRIMAWRDRRRHDRELVEWCHSHRLVFQYPDVPGPLLDMSFAELHLFARYAGYDGKEGRKIAPFLTVQKDDDGPETAPSLSRQNAASDPRPEQQ